MLTSLSLFSLDISFINMLMCIWFCGGLFKKDFISLLMTTIERKMWTKTSVQQNEFTNDDDDDDEQGYKGIKLQLCISFYHFPAATKSV